MTRQDPNQHPNPASAKEKAEGSRENLNVEPPRESEELDGKTDSGPEPEVHGRDIPPQD
jgi:hypothetical protein